MGPENEMRRLLTLAATRADGTVGLLKVAQVAGVLGYSRQWIRTHATLLGATRVGKNGDLRFTVEGIVRALTFSVVVERQPGGPWSAPAPAKRHGVTRDIDPMLIKQRPRPQAQAGDAGQGA